MVGSCPPIRQQCGTTWDLLAGDIEGCLRTMLTIFEETQKHFEPPVQIARFRYGTAIFPQFFSFGFDPP